MFRLAVTRQQRRTGKMWRSRPMAATAASCLATACCFLAASLDASADEQAPRPNVVLILADDLGWSDTTLYGTTKFYRTPNIERLAARGMTFKRAYSASPLCSPTRASILTGQSPARHGITSPTCHLPQVILQAAPGRSAPPAAKSVPVTSVTRLSTDHYTLAEALHDAGYATGHFGKWHLGHEPYSPLQHGFDVDVPHWPGPGPAGSYVAPWKFPDFDPDTPHEHIEDRMAREAVTFMEQHRDSPFFLNYWMFSVHAPFDAKRDLISKYRATVDAENPQRCPTYAAMIESMDDAVGTLLAAMDRLKIADRTIVVFASDNGGNMYNLVEGERPTSNAPLRGGKATMYEGGIRGPCCVIWPDVVRPGSQSSVPITSCDFYPSLLEMIGLPSRAGYRFDGVSIVPALQGKALQREAIFTYFPHSPKVPDWLPPAISVHRGDWKLIRVFHGGENGAHRWMLFNLNDDAGELRDLASSQPARVKQLDALISAFLSETQAVLPTRNPDFDPARYRPDLVGKQMLARDRSRPTRSSAARRVAGWRPDHHCTASVEENALQITCTGNDPHLSFRLPMPLPAGQYVLHTKITSQGRGRGQWFWQEQGVKPAFFRDRSTTFDLTHDGTPQEVQVRFSAEKPVVAVRLDPGQGPGQVRISDMQVRTPDGHLRFAWKFAKSTGRNGKASPDEG